MHRSNNSAAHKEYERQKKQDALFAETEDIQALLLDMSDNEVNPHYYISEGDFYRGPVPCPSRRVKTLKRLLDEHWIEKSIQNDGIDLRLTSAGRMAVDLVRKQQKDSIDDNQRETASVQPEMGREESGTHQSIP